MKFLRVVGFLALGATLAHANEWTDEQSKKNQTSTAKVAAAPGAVTTAPTASTPAAPAVSKTAAPATASPTPAVKKAPAAVATTPAPVAKSATAPASDSASHVVVKGDTLWGLADSFYQNPYEWKKIWDANKSEIENPDMIFPDQKFVIPGKKESAAVKKEEPAEEEEAPAAEQEKPAASAKAEEKAPAAKVEEKADDDTSAEAPAEEPVKEESTPPVMAKKTSKTRDAFKTGTFLTDQEWEGSGKIVGDQDHKILLGQGDIVYLNIGAANGVKSKMRGTIYRRGRMVRDPNTGSRLGYAINRVGGVEITQEVTDNTATAIIVSSEDPVRVGDFVSLDE